MKVWMYRVLLLGLLFGVSSLTYGSNQLSPILTIVTNLAGLVASTGLMLFYFKYPLSYKVLAWVITLGVIALILESLYIYNQYVYSFFVVKRFAYCGLALLAFVVVGRAGQLKIEWTIWIIIALFVYSLLIEGKLFSYSLDSDTRPTSAYETFYLVIPFLYYLVRYITQQKRVDLLKTLSVFGIIVLLLHRSVITTTVFAGLIVFFLAAAGRVADSRLKIFRTMSTLTLLAILVFPFIGILSPAKTAAFIENIGGIFSPEEDNTGSWRLEQSRYYWKGIEERPLLGWRYEGYDRGEIMENEDFAEKGTIIHSQYIDMLYNYGSVGLLINLLMIFTTLWVLYFQNRKLSIEQTVLFGFIVSGLLFGVSYQLPVYYWGFVGVGMFYGFKRPLVPKGPYYTSETASKQQSTPIQTTLLNVDSAYD